MQSNRMTKNRKQFISIRISYRNSDENRTRESVGKKAFFEIVKQIACDLWNACVRYQWESKQNENGMKIRFYCTCAGA